MLYTKKEKSTKRLGQCNCNNKLIYGQYTSRYNRHHTHTNTNTHTPHSKSKYKTSFVFDRMRCSNEGKDSFC